MDGQRAPEPTSGALVCLVQGCGTDLRNHKRYFQHRRICQDHHGADVIMIEDVARRFCQQCGSLHSIDKFEGSKHSCRESLNKRSARRKGDSGRPRSRGQAKPSSSSPATQQRTGLPISTATPGVDPDTQITMQNLPTPRTTAAGDTSGSSLQDADAEGLPMWASTRKRSMAPTAPGEGQHPFDFQPGAVPHNTRPSASSWPSHGERGTESPNELQPPKRNPLAMPSCDSPLHWQQQQQQQQQGRPRMPRRHSMQVLQHTGPAAAGASHTTQQLRHRAASVPHQQPAHLQARPRHSSLQGTSAPQQQEQQHAQRLQQQQEERGLLTLKQLQQQLHRHHPPAAGPGPEAALMQDPILRSLLQEDLAQQQQEGEEGEGEETGRASHNQQQQQQQQEHHQQQHHHQPLVQQGSPSPATWPDMVPGSFQLQQQQDGASCRASPAPAPAPGPGLGPGSNPALVPLPTAEASAAMALGSAPAPELPFHSSLQLQHHHHQFYHQHVPGAQAGQPEPPQEQPQEQQAAAWAVDMGTADGASWHEQLLLDMDTGAGSGAAAGGPHLAADTAPLDQEQQEQQQLPALRLHSTEFNLPMARPADTGARNTFDYPDELRSPTGLMPMPTFPAHHPGWPEPAQHALQHALLLSPPHKRRRWEPAADEGWPADLDRAGGFGDIPAQHAAAGAGHVPAPASLLQGAPSDKLLAGGGNGEPAASTHIHGAHVLHVNGTQLGHNGAERQSSGSGLRRQRQRSAAAPEQNDGGSLAAAGPLAAWGEGDPLPPGLEAAISRVVRRDINLLLPGLVQEAVQAAVGPAVRQALQLLLEA